MVEFEDAMSAMADTEKIVSGGKSSDWGGGGRSLYKFAKSREISFKYEQTL
jgi:hypothetical protein